MIVGIDEVGRGPWAGPLVVGAVVLGNTPIPGLTDSKRLSKAKRESIAKDIMAHAAACGIGWVDARELDQVGLSAALTLATKRAVEQITIPYHEIIIDGTVNFLKDTGKGAYVTTMKKADLLISSVSAASIIAKVARDDYMSDLDEIYPDYAFGSHVGYGTAKHRAAIERYGITEEHRMSFAPIKKLAGIVEPRPSHQKQSMRLVGNVSETAAANCLASKGYEILERNWRTRFCEIDIICQQHHTLYFIEVKHRTSSEQGGGVAAITEKKLRQMRFAASLFLASSSNQDARLAVITTTGKDSVQVEQMLCIE